ncbi:MAG: hemolysin family protein [Gemmatimonadaceae bacterium]
MVDIGALVLAVAASALAGLCAVSDGALLALDPDDNLSAPLRALYDRREKTHRALAFARIVAQLMSGAFVSWGLWSLAATSQGRFFLGALAALVLVGVSESLARSAGDTLGARAAERFYRFIVLTERLLLPVVTLGTAIDRGLLVLLPPPAPRESDREATAEQFREVVAAEAEASREQKVLLKGVFALGDTEVQEIMVPRVDIVAVDRLAPWSEVVDRVRSAEHARLPVFSQTIDNVVGILYAKDLLPWVVAGEPPAAGWDSLMRPPVFIPGAKKADAQLRDFQASRSHLAIVADEFGGTAGLITIEDVLEEIVGEIRDENDVEEPPIDRDDAGRRYWVSARVTLGELSELLGQDFSSDDVSTVGGLVYELLGRVPRSGEELELNGYRVVVERVVRRRVHRVYFERLDKAGHRRVR